MSRGVESVLDRMLAESAISDLDLQFARLMTRMDEGAGERLAAAAGLVSSASGQGHTSVGMDELAARAEPFVGDADKEALRGVISASPVCGNGDAPTPLVLDGDRVYLYRYFRYERSLATMLRERNRPIDDAPDATWLRERLDRLFASEADEVDWQRVAAALAMLRRLVVISGGPGTGKTSTVVRLLALILDHAGEEDCRIALAAPTGKAAARMQQAIDRARDNTALGESLLDRIPRRASTIHRLLGSRSRGSAFTYNAENRLPVDVVVVDEVSMVDLALMCRLFEALPDDARIVLLGDRDQLASVEPGNVFADLCVDANRFSAQGSATLSAATGYDLAPSDPEALPDACVSLAKSYRFGEDSGIGALAAAVREQDAERVLRLLDDEALADIELWPIEAGGLEAMLRERLLAEFRERIEAAAASGDAPGVLARYARRQILCAVRSGPEGVRRVNNLVERMLAEGADAAMSRDWYVGRPLMVTANDYGLDLFNGDMGILLPYGAAGEPRACFVPDGEEPHWFHPARLPEHETAWAMTVHKSQGSEFDAVVVILPNGDSPVLSRELIYTAVTRARRRVEIWGSKEILAQAVQRPVARYSGIARRVGSGGSR